MTERLSVREILELEDKRSSLGVAITFVGENPDFKYLAGAQDAAEWLREITELLPEIELRLKEYIGMCHIEDKKYPEEENTAPIVHESFLKLKSLMERMGV
jgi:hypothetical protein